MLPSATLVPVVTALSKVAPLLCTKVNVFNATLWPTLPTTLTAPVLPALSVNDCVLAVVPLTAPPSVRLPPLVLSVRSSPKVSAVLLSPKLMAVWVVFRVPAALRPAGAVALIPPAKVRVSPAALPSTKLPVFKKVVAVLAALTCVCVPSNSTL